MCLKHCKMRGVKDDVIAYSSLINGFGKASKTEEALGVFRSMKVAAYDPDVISYRSLITACAHEGKTEEAFDTVKCMHWNRC